MAIREWAKLNDGDVVPLERGLAAFDMFVLHDRDGDFHDVRTYESEPTIAAKNARWPVILTVLHRNFAARTRNLGINRHNKMPLRSQNS